MEASLTKTKEEVIWKVQDWIRRLDDLYRQIEEWHLDLSDVKPKQFLKGSSLQMDEGPMQEHDVPPVMIETVAIIYGRYRITFDPAATWIIGANGRINVTTNDNMYILLDMGGEDGRPSDWRIAQSRIRKENYPFNKQVFHNLVRHLVIEAA